MVPVLALEDQDKPHLGETMSDLQVRLRRLEELEIVDQQPEHDGHRLMVPDTKPPAQPKSRRDQSQNPPLLGFGHKGRNSVTVKEKFGFLLVAAVNSAAAPSASGRLL